jgi:predicted metal-dependent phosphoesterase TrpH
MRIDLHAHTNRSDGTLSPTELVRHAADVGVDILGITDHDCTEGWDEALEAAVDSRVTLVRGIEISCRFSGQGVHLLAYLPDPAYPPLVEELQRVLDGRNARLPATLQKLRALGIEIDSSDVRRVAGEAAAMGRPHVADALVELHVVADRDEAFERFLGPGGPAYVDRYAADLVTMIGLIRESGGISVVAHPWAKRHDHSALDLEGFAALKSEGLVGIEVDHEDHVPQTRKALREVAAELDLVVTGSSDFHGAGKSGHDLACNTTAPEEYERLMALATAAAESAGRSVPTVVVA